ncbi:hypothetical protein PGT21_009052 [Puccinia graminis f. sp. tritici]|uniref:Uncharacterized protein n=1 Tax=Puccinia graminis f. sp. tritici TaxID=56615 RepID=A0A5B0R1U5_PUCGR|nr:hypothetical protein PGT21_009052 [Puccinia graminis f. sp. tritici]
MASLLISYVDQIDFIEIRHKQMTHFSPSLRVDRVPMVSSLEADPWRKLLLAKTTTS